MLPKGETTIYALSVGSNSLSADIISADMLLKDVHVGNGKVVPPSGRQYFVLQTPHYGKLLPEVVAKIEKLLQQGVTIVASITNESPCLSSYPECDQKVKTMALRIWGDKMYTSLMKLQRVRICRDVSTERDLFNCGGTFYELPPENASGFANIKPIGSHEFVINDYNSCRGMLFINGIDSSLVKDNAHVVISNNKKCAVRADEVSKPYLFSGYDQKALSMSQKSVHPIQYSKEIDPLGENN